MARQSKREVAETPLWSVDKVVNVASSMVTMAPITSGSCSGIEARHRAVREPRVPQGHGNRAPSR